MTPAQLADATMIELFRLEADDQTRVLTDGLLALEREPAAPEALGACMRAAHSLKGAARIIGFDPGVQVAHLLEDALLSAQRSAAGLDRTKIDWLLRGADLLRRIGNLPEAEISGGA
ncbi:MAG TPA: Hpt domain-containing protein, partial [Gammaproteobacteria bacterium]|nr:Hpt domain-containing protein [Gammaproteobacteria bacterium]